MSNNAGCNKNNLSNCESNEALSLSSACAYLKKTKKKKKTFKFKILFF